MAIKVSKVIWFRCEWCGHEQYREYSLKEGWLDGRAVLLDMIVCERCGHDNEVYEDLLCF